MTATPNHALQRTAPAVTAAASCFSLSHRAAAARASAVVELGVVRHTSMTKHLFVGGLVAAGFDDSGRFLLTVSHAERGVFAVGTWERVARDSTLVYPENGYVIGIGPIEGQSIKVTEDYEGSLKLTNPGSFHLVYDSGTITITDGRA